MESIRDFKHVKGHSTIVITISGHGERIGDLTNYGENYKLHLKDQEGYITVKRLIERILVTFYEWLMDASKGRGDEWIKGDAKEYDAIPDITLIVDACFSGAFCHYLKE